LVEFGPIGCPGTIHIDQVPISRPIEGVFPCVIAKFIEGKDRFGVITVKNQSQAYAIVRSRKDQMIKGLIKRNGIIKKNFPGLTSQMVGQIKRLEKQYDQ
jgi:hypothetical protein